MDQDLANVVDSFRTSTKEFIDMLSQLGTAYPIIAKLKVKMLLFSKASTLTCTVHNTYCYYLIAN